MVQYLSSLNELKYLVVAGYSTLILFLLRKIHGFVERTGSSVCGNWKQNGHIFKMPQMILLATNISNDEFDKAKSACFSDTVMMKPLRTSMVGACLQQVLGTGKKRQPGKEMPDGSTSV